MIRIAYSINEAAEVAAVTKWVIIEAIRDGLLTGIHHHNKMLVDGNSLRAWSYQGARPAGIEIAAVRRGISLTDDGGVFEPERLTNLI